MGNKSRGDPPRAPPKSSKSAKKGKGSSDLRTKLLKKALIHGRNSDKGEQAEKLTEVQALRFRSPNPLYYIDPETNEEVEVRLFSPFTRPTRLTYFFHALLVYSCRIWQNSCC